MPNSEPSPYSEPSTTQTLTEEFRTQLQRTVDLLNSMPLDQIERAGEQGAVAERAFDLSLAMVRSTEELSEHAPRELPVLRAHGVGSQLAVVGGEMAAAALAASDRLSADLTLIARISDLLMLRRSTTIR